MEIKVNIDHFIKESGLSRKFIAKKMDVSVNQLLAWRKGEYYPPVDKAFMLAEILNCSVYDLFKKETNEWKVVIVWKKSVNAVRAEKEWISF